MRLSRVPIHCIIGTASGTLEGNGESRADALRWNIEFGILLDFGVLGSGVGELWLTFLIFGER